jgi:hypothetical protein
MRLKNVIHMAAFIGLCAGAASAQDRASRFVQRDGNGDGVLTPHEYQSTGGHPGNFRALDTNRDGVLSREEFLGRAGAAEAEAGAVYRDEDVLYKDNDVLYKSTPGSAMSIHEAFRIKDRNRDGRLTRNEYGDPRTFDRVDSDDDGRISAYEYANPPSATSAQGRFDDLDRNDDGTLTRREFDGSAATFRALDRNRDGRVSRREFVS